MQESSGSSTVSFLQVWRNVPSSHRRLIVGMSLLDFFTFCCLSMIGPFFPSEAAKKGMSTATSGFVFSVYSFIVVLASPVFGKLLPVIGTKFGLVAGSFTAAYCCVLFGILDEVQDGVIFAVLCFAVRSVEALGAALYNIAIFALVCEYFRGNVGAVLAIGEVILSLGLTSGPVLGSSLYALGGYKLPFIVTGCVFLLTSLASIVFVPVDRTCGVKPAPSGKLLKDPRMIFGAVLVTTMSIGLGCLYPTLQPHVMAIGLSESKAALVFLVDTASSSVFGLFTGALSDRCGNRKWIMMVSGVGLIGISLVLIGPTPVLPFLQNSLWWNIICLVIHGLGAALALVPSISYFNEEAIAMGYADDLSLHSLVSGFWQSLFSAGEVIGPIVGAALSDAYGFAWQSTVVGLFCCGVALSAVSFYVCCGARKGETDVMEREPLLSSDSDLAA